MQFVGGASESMRGEKWVKRRKGLSVAAAISRYYGEKEGKRGKILLDTGRRRRRRRSAKYLSQSLWLKRPCLNPPHTSSLFPEEEQSRD